MAFSIKRDEIVTYPAEALRQFEVYGYEWIDDLWFCRAPEEILGAKAPDYVAVAKEIFLEAGWMGDGDVQLIWLPPFVFPMGPPRRPEGVVVWHVKQEEDGVSFLLSPLKLPFEEFQPARRKGRRWTASSFIGRVVSWARGRS